MVYRLVSPEFLVCTPYLILVFDIAEVLLTEEIDLKGFLSPFYYFQLRLPPTNSLETRFLFEYLTVAAFRC